MYHEFKLEFIRTNSVSGTTAIQINPLTSAYATTALHMLYLFPCLFPLETDTPLPWWNSRGSPLLSPFIFLASCFPLSRETNRLSHTEIWWKLPRMHTFLIYLLIHFASKMIHFLWVPPSHNPSPFSFLLPWESAPPPPGISPASHQVSVGLDASSPSEAKQGSKLGEQIWQTGKSFRNSLHPSCWGTHMKTELHIRYIWDAYLLNMSTNPESCGQF